MTERTFRLAIGIWLVVALFFNQSLAIYLLIAVLMFEGLTNWRVPMLITRLRYGEHGPAAQPQTCMISFEAERALRLILVGFLAVGLLQQEWLWWMPWLVGFALIGAGLSGICPMVMALRGIGMR